MSVIDARSRLTSSKDSLMMILGRDSLPEVLMAEDAQLLSLLEDCEVLVIRKAFCPDRALRTFAARFEAVLHGQKAPTPPPDPQDYLIVGDPGLAALTDFVRNSRFWESDWTPRRAGGAISIMANPGPDEIRTNTEFCCTAAVWDGLTRAEQRKLASMRVLHAFWHDQLYHERVPSHSRLMQWMASQSAELPLVEDLPGGRHCLLVDDSAIQIRGMAFSESETYLGLVRNWATEGPYVYVHDWQPGDLVIWNSASVMYRDLPRRDNPVWSMANAHY
jgi:alpha-ketoglutarate-dependent taurine dioxygenase